MAAVAPGARTSPPPSPRHLHAARRRSHPPPAAAAAAAASIRPGDPLPETGDGLVDLAALADADGRVTIAGFGSLLSARSARFTFPDLVNFRTGRLTGSWRRVFAHTTAVFHSRGVARPATREVASLSVEPAPPGTPPLVVSLFEVDADERAAAALVDREHEFRLIAVPAVDEEGGSGGVLAPPRLAVVCAAWNDADYRAARCPPDEWARRYTGTHPDGSPFAIQAVWDDPAVLPCRAYLRHCVLAARRLGPAAEACLLTNTWLADRATRLDAWLAAHPGIMEEEPPAELRERYSG
jgi:hypothetical protein